MLCAPWHADAVALATALADLSGCDLLVRSHCAPARDGAAGKLRAMVDDLAAAELRAHALGAPAELLLALPQFGVERARRFVQGLAMAHGVDLMTVTVQRSLIDTLKLPEARGKGREVRREHAAFERPLDADLPIDAMLPLEQQLAVFQLRWAKKTAAPEHPGAAVDVAQAISRR